MSKRRSKTVLQIHCYRRLVIIIENDTIGDRHWMPTVAESLRQYANALDGGSYGNTSPEIMETGNGNKLTILGGSYIFEAEFPAEDTLADMNIPKVIKTGAPTQKV